MDICALGARIGLDSLLHTLSHVQRGSSCDDAMVLRFFDASDVHVAVPLPPTLALLLLTHTCHCFSFIPDEISYSAPRHRTMLNPK